MVGHAALNRRIGVRVPASQPIPFFFPPNCLQGAHCGCGAHRFAQGQPKDLRGLSERIDSAVSSPYHLKVTRTFDAFPAWLEARRAAELFFKKQEGGYRVKKEKIIRAWTDPDYRATLSDQELAALPANPAGQGCEELSEADLRNLNGALQEEMVDRIGPGWKATVTLDCSNSLTCQAWSWLAC